MNSSQVNFYLLPEELPEVESFLKDLGSFFIKQPLIDKKVEEIKTLSSGSSKKQWSKVLATKPNYLDEIDINFVETQNYYLIDALENPIMEYSIGGIRQDGNLGRSRFYFISGFWNEKREWQLKDEEFIKFCKSVMQKFKKKFLKKMDDGDWATEKAIEWRRQNVGVKFTYM